MISGLLKSSFKLFNVSMRSYAAIKIMAKTGMTYPEILLFKESLKDGTKFCCEKLSIFLRAKSQARRAIRAQRLAAKKVACEPEIVKTTNKINTKS